MAACVDRYAWTCAADEHVIGNTCVACADGYENGAGDDASLSDTSCSRIARTGYCMGNTDSRRDVYCIDSDMLYKPDPDTIHCGGGSCRVTECCDPRPRHIPSPSLNDMATLSQP